MEEWIEANVPGDYVHVKFDWQEDDEHDNTKERKNKTENSLDPGRLTFRSQELALENEQVFELDQIFEERRYVGRFRVDIA